MPETRATWARQMAERFGVAAAKRASGGLGYYLRDDDIVSESDARLAAHFAGIVLEEADDLRDALAAEARYGTETQGAADHDLRIEAVRDRS